MHASGTRSPRHGFTLIEIVIAAAIVLVMAALTLPSFGSYLDMENAKQARSQLDALRLSITNPNSVGQNNLAGNGKLGFAQLVVAKGSTTDIFPSYISQLVIPITTSDFRCRNGNTAVTKYTAGVATDTTLNVGHWNKNGPFFNQGIIKGTTSGGSSYGGLITAIGTIRDTVVRTQPAASNSTVELWLDSLDLQDAQNIDLLVDNVVNANAGSVQYGILTGTYYRLRYIFPITDNGCP